MTKAWLTFGFGTPTGHAALPDGEARETMHNMIWLPANATQLSINSGWVVRVFWFKFRYLFIYFDELPSPYQDRYFLSIGPTPIPVSAEHYSNVMHVVSQLKFAVVMYFISYDSRWNLVASNKWHVLQLPLIRMLNRSTFSFNFGYGTPSFGAISVMTETDFASTAPLSVTACNWKNDFLLADYTDRSNNYSIYDADIPLGIRALLTISKTICLHYLFSMLHNIGAFNLQWTFAANLSKLLDYGNYYITYHTAEIILFSSNLHQCMDTNTPKSLPWHGNALLCPLKFIKGKIYTILALAVLNISFYNYAHFFLWLWFYNGPWQT